MTEDSESHQPENGLAPTSSSASTSKRTAGKKLEIPKRKYGKTTFRLPLNYEHALVLARVQLERAGEEIHTIPQMIEQAIERYTDFLRVKKSVDFLGVIPTKIVPPK